MSLRFTLKRSSIRRTVWTFLHCCTRAFQPVETQHDVLIEVTLSDGVPVALMNFLVLASSATLNENALR